MQHRGVDGGRQIEQLQRFLVGQRSRDRQLRRLERLGVRRRRLVERRHFDRNRGGRWRILDRRGLQLPRFDRGLFPAVRHVLDGLTMLQWRRLRGRILLRRRR
jgi:hypothetical protein